MTILVLAVASVGVCAFTFALWLTGFGAADARASSRLNRIRQAEEEIAKPSNQSKSNIARKQGATVSFRSIKLVPTNVAKAWEEELTRAGLKLHVKEYFILRAGVGLVAGFFAYTLIPYPNIQLGGAAVGFVVGFFLSAMFVKSRISRRRARMEDQVMDLLPLVASGLRSGFGLVQALTTVSDQMEGPLKVEIDRMLRDIAIGASVEEAFDGLSGRVGSPEFDIVVTAILIQREVGGNLANILEGVAETMRERKRIKGEIKALTAQQRLTGFVIGGLPVAMFALFWVLNPEFERLLFTDPLGRMMLAGAVTSEVLGFLVILKIIKIEV
ncbi:MAG TPA: type II secretion system F family protein [Dehalococcoidia bacterium]|nr:type II secretion system F family protein [Dehalococcoidia bacterium]